MNRSLRFIVLILVTGLIIIDFYQDLLQISINRFFTLGIIIGVLGLSMYISSRQTEYKDLKETYRFQRNSTVYVLVLVIVLNILSSGNNESVFRINNIVFWIVILLSFADVYKTKQTLKNMTPKT